MGVGFATWLALLRVASSSSRGKKMKERKSKAHKKNRFDVWSSKWSRQSGYFNNGISRNKKFLSSKKWNDESLKNDSKDQQIAGNQAKARKKFAGQTSGTQSGHDSVEEGKLNKNSNFLPLTNAVAPLQAAKPKYNLCGKTLTSRQLSENLVHEDSASEPPKISKARKQKNERACSLEAARRQGKRHLLLIRQRCSRGLWPLRSCNLPKIGRVPLFMMQRKSSPIAACGKLQSEKLRARKTSYRLLDFNWMWFQKSFWNCCKKTLRSRIRKTVSYLKFKLQRRVRAGRRSYDMNIDTSGILYEIPQCTTKSCLRDDAVQLQTVGAQFGNAASSASLFKDSQQPLLCTPAQWCGTDTLPKIASDVPAINNQPDDLCALLPEKEDSITCQDEATSQSVRKDEHFLLTANNLHECANTAFDSPEHASFEIFENDDETCPMDTDESSDSVIFLTELLDHPYSKSPLQQDPSKALELECQQNGPTTTRTVTDADITSCVCDFLNDFVKRYGSLIPLNQKDILTRLKETFNQDFSDRMPLISKEIAKYRAKNSRNIGCGFQTSYNRHTIYMEDLVTLDDQQWLNDQVINMYGDLIMDASPDKIHFFNTFFHKQLVTKGYDGVKRWTKKVDLFKKTLLLIPIHLQVHWALVAVNIPKKTITYYDSQGLNMKCCTENILKYLMTEAKEKNRPEFLHGWQTTIKKCIPQQKNDFDCGVFMLQYCKCLAQEQNFLFSQEDMPLIRKRIYKELCDRRFMD